MGGGGRERGTERKREGSEGAREKEKRQCAGGGGGQIEIYIMRRSEIMK